MAWPSSASYVMISGTLITLIACGRRSTDSPVAASGSRDDSPVSGLADAQANEDTLDAATTDEPNDGFPPGFVVNLEPSADCIHPEVIANCKDGFCRIPPGCFIMGAPRDEFGAARDFDVQVQVTLTRPFEIGTFEVTNQMWLEEGFDTPLRDQDVGVCREPNCPIGNVNLYETLTFVNRYSEQRGLSPCYELRECTGTFGSGTICNKPGDRPGTLTCERTEEDGLDCAGLYTTASSVYECEGYRLPTEAEWEYAARGGTRTAFWNGPIPQATGGTSRAKQTET